MRLFGSKSSASLRNSQDDSVISRRQNHLHIRIELILVPALKLKQQIIISYKLLNDTICVDLSI